MADQKQNPKSQRPKDWDEVEELLPTNKALQTIRNFAQTGYDLTKLEDCAEDAGYKHPRTSAIKALKSASRNPFFQRALINYGVTLEKLAEKLAQLLDAKHPAYPLQNDNVVQFKALQFAADVHQVMPTPEIKVQREEDFHLHVSADIIHRIQEAKRIPREFIDVEPDSSPDDSGENNKK